MPRKPIDLPPEVVEDMRAFFAEKNAIKRDKIAARSLPQTAATDIKGSATGSG